MKDCSSSRLITMLSSIVIRRLLLQSFMKPLLVIKIDPALGWLRKRSQRAIGPAFGYGKLKHANKSLCVAVVCGRACSAHGTLEPFEQERGSRLLRSVLTPLITVPDDARHREFDHLNGRHDQVSAHAIIKRQSKNMPRSFPQRETATHFGAIRQLHFKGI